MPSGPKKRRAQKKKKETAAEREKTENEAPPTASSKENSPVMQIESTDGVTAVFDEPSVVLPKRTVLLEKMMASEVLDLKRKGTKESIKETPLTEVYSSDQSSNVAEPLETCQADKIDVVVESSVVAAPGVIELDSQDKDGSSIMATNVCDFEGKESKVILKNAETDTVATDATEHLQDDDVSSIIASDDTDAVKSLATGPCDFDLNAAERLNAENAANVDAAEDQRASEHKEDNPVEKKQHLVTPENRVGVENQETAAPNEEDAPGTFEVGEVEAAVQNKEDAISEDDNEIVKDALEAGAENQVNAALNEVDAPEKIEAVEVEEVEVAAKNQEDDITGDVSEIEKKNLEAAAEDQITAAPNEVDAPEKTEEAVAVDKVEAFIAAKSALDLVSQTHDAVSAELVTPEVIKQLKEMKVIIEDVKVFVEDVLDRLNAIDALLHRS